MWCQQAVKRSTELAFTGRDLSSRQLVGRCVIWSMLSSVPLTGLIARKYLWPQDYMTAWNWVIGFLSIYAVTAAVFQIRHRMPVLTRLICAPLSYITYVLCAAAGTAIFGAITGMSNGWVGDFFEFFFGMFGQSVILGTAPLFALLGSVASVALLCAVLQPQPTFKELGCGKHAPLAPPNDVTPSAIEAPPD
jgi:hypothetical protein